MDFFHLLSLACGIGCIFSVIWWVADKLPVVPGPMGQRFTLTYLWGFYTGPRRR